MKFRTVLVGLGLLGVVGLAHRAQAQGAPTRQVAVAIVDSLSAPTARAEILRFSDASRPDVILLRRETANAADLAAAIVTYRASIARTPSRPGLMARTVLGAHAGDAAPAAALRARATEMLSQVRRTPLSRVGNYGRGRWSLFSVRVDG